MTLRDGNREYFYAQLDKKFPNLKEQYIKEYGNSYIINSKNNAKLMKIFHEFCEENKIEHNPDKIFGYLNEFEDKTKFEQLSFFD